MFSKILIANRGEIALRIIQACRDLGISTVAVHSTADNDSLHVAYADEDVCIGPPAVRDSYLSVTALISAAEISGAEAIHPGYGFLAESAHFAEVVEECGLTWIGPRPETIRLMGDKAKARETALAAGAPVLPGSQQPLRNASDARAMAQDVGYPVILKAAAGGGGRGMRVVMGPEQIETQFLTAQSEAISAFGNGSLYLEKYLVDPRHIEVQILGDRMGKVIHLGERECSIQRRHQKLIEEAPSRAIDADLRARITDAAVAVATTVGYENAGTIEFLLDAEGRFYFMEMNTRIQVEHPVTEMVTSVDLVREQIAIASGEELGMGSVTEARGHAIECRINAEHPRTFTPSPGAAQDLPRAGRSRNPRRHARLRGLCVSALLRFPDRQGDRAWKRSHGGDRPPASGVGPVRHPGHRHHARSPPRDPSRSGLRSWRHLDWIHGALPQGALPGRSARFRRDSLPLFSCSFS